MTQIGQADFFMKPYIFSASTVIRTTPEKLYNFHQNPENIALVAPSSLVVKRVECSPRARSGETFSIEARQFGLPIHWKGMWETAREPGLLVDTASESPFAIWRHSHIFEPDERGAKLTDRVEFLLKGGIAGRLASRFFLLPILFPAMFRSRHEATHRHFENQ